jgi:hypothetical protein
VALSADGNRMAVMSFARVYVFERSGSTWRQVRVLQRRSTAEAFIGLAMSVDGNTFAVTATESGAVEGSTTKVLVYRHCPCGDGWRLAADLRSAKPGSADSFGSAFIYDRTVSLSANGKTLAVGAPRDHGDITDLAAGPAQGSIYVFGEDDDGVWRRHAYLRTRSAANWDAIGRTVELDAEGKVLVTKACGYAANDVGVRRNHRAGATAGSAGPDCDETFLTHAFGGAIYVFERDAAGRWSHAAAALPAPGEDTFFESTAIAFSGDAQTSAISVASLAAGVPPLRVEVY